MPGTLPLLNKRVVEFAVRTGIATNCTITQNNKFDRKNYFYPDLPKAYQISQLYLPICRNGFIEVKDKDGNSKKIGIHEIHMEEDAGKLVHDEFEDCTLVDYNRCGVPLLEIVSEPDFRSAEEVLSYLTELRSILQYIGVSDCKMQEGSLRADVNLSVRPKGQKEFGTRTEMKNLNSFRAIARAIEYEAERQIELLEDGEKVMQETRRWDDNKGYSYAMRSKEDAQDYRYFPEPDLVPIVISDEWIAKVKANQPELRTEKLERYQREFDLPKYDQVMTLYTAIRNLIQDGAIVSAYALDGKGLAAAVSKIAFGNKLGVTIEDEVTSDTLFAPGFGNIVAEVPVDALSKVREVIDAAGISDAASVVGYVSDKQTIERLLQRHRL